MNENNNVNIALMIDMQHDFIKALGDKGWDACTQAELMLTNKNFDFCLATQDWHPKSHISFAKNHEDKQPMDVIETDKGEQTLWPTHCVQETEGAMIDTMLNRFPDVVFRKGKYHDKEAYSIFDEPKTGNLFTQLIDQLVGDIQAKEETNIYLFGVATDVCVEATGIDLAKLGLPANLYLVENCCAGISEEDSKNAKQNLLNAGYKIIQYEYSEESE